MFARSVGCVLRTSRQQPLLQRQVLLRPKAAMLPSSMRAMSSEAAPEVDLEALNKKAAELREQIAELKDKAGAIKADTMHAQKRHVTDLNNETKYGITKFAKQMLQVVDNLQRAADSVKKEDMDEDKQLRKMHASVTHMKETMTEALEKFGVAPMEPMDQPFNPEQHEAMFQMAMPGKDPNTIFHVMEPGYTIHDRTLRAAKVGVVAG
eukprot:TRINITY_DN17607_c0_g4_i1.p2 TRINITY_DN17607_c0_g4~~TRINITY_DN17607_c0_g4_i1.p2  ORF type:complete len:208 (-),score=68.90 TRINITY_DN17607_c0_g4_i1:219-842(-)